MIIFCLLIAPMKQFPKHALHWHSYNSGIYYITMLSIHQLPTNTPAACTQDKTIPQYYYKAPITKMRSFFDYHDISKLYRSVAVSIEEEENGMVCVHNFSFFIYLTTYRSDKTDNRFDRYFLKERFSQTIVKLPAFVKDFRSTTT